MKRITTFLSAIFISQLLVAQTINTARLDSLFTALDQKNMAMGAVAIYRQGQPVYSHHWGLRDNSGSIVVDSNTKYRIGSITKTFTAVIIMQLIEEHKLSYDTRLSVFFPQVPYADSITVQQMLNHHSGLPPFDQETQIEALKDQPDVDALIKKVAGEKGDVNDRQNGRYSNLNYVLLGLVIEKVTHTTYQAQLQLRITGKLGLKNTYSLPGVTSADRNEAPGFFIKKGKWMAGEEKGWNFMDAAGDIVSTPEDLDIFFSSLFAGKLVSGTSIKRMTTFTDRYGYGLFETPFYNKKAWGNTGRIGAYTCSSNYFIDDTLSISLTLNGQVYPMTDIMVGILSIVFNKPFNMPTFESKKLNSDQLAALTGTYEGKDISAHIRITAKNGRLYAISGKKWWLFNNKTRFDAIAPTRFIYDGQGIFLNFNKNSSGACNSFTMTVAGAKMHFDRKS